MTKIFVKMFILMFLGSFVLFATGCQSQKSPESLTTQEEQVKELNEQRGGVGLDFNYEGPNTDIKPSEPE